LAISSLFFGEFFKKKKKKNKTNKYIHFVFLLAVESNLSTSSLVLGGGEKGGIFANFST
jgi:hypothetical protein